MVRQSKVGGMDPVQSTVIQAISVQSSAFVFNHGSFLFNSRTVGEVVSLIFIFRISR